MGYANYHEYPDEAHPRTDGDQFAEAVHHIVPEGMSRAVRFSIRDNSCN